MAAVGVSSEPLPHWKLVENVVAAIEVALSMVDGTVVTPNVMVPGRLSGLARQVDVRVRGRCRFLTLVREHKPHPEQKVGGRGRPRAFSMGKAPSAA